MVLALRSMALARAGMRSFQQIPQRFASTSSEAGAKPVSPHIGFYKTFGRPIAKVLLMATFTYQLAYWGWVKLEKEEMKREKSAELADLEKHLGELTAAKGTGKV